MSNINNLVFEDINKKIVKSGVWGFNIGSIGGGAVGAVAGNILSKKHKLKAEEYKEKLKKEKDPEERKKIEHLIDYHTKIYQNSYLAGSLIGSTIGSVAGAKLGIQHGYRKYD